MSKHDLQARPDLPPHPRIHRSPPDDRVRRDGRQPLHRDTKPVGASRSSSAPARRYRTVHIKAGRQRLTAADPLPDDLRDALAKIGYAGVH